MGHTTTSKIKSDRLAEKDPFLLSGVLKRKNSRESLRSLQLDKESGSSGSDYLSDKSCVLAGKCPDTKSWCLLIVGLLSILLGVLCMAFSDILEGGVLLFIQQSTALISSSPMFIHWLVPPIVPNLQVYLFNITNPKEVLSGLEPKLEEVGPYVYSAQHVHTVVKDQDYPADVLAYNSRTIYKFLPHLSVGSETDAVNMLNLVMLTGFNKARYDLEIVKEKIILPVLTTTGSKEVVVSTTVGGFLFGYEEELACILEQRSPEAEADDNAEDEDDEDWMDWSEEDEAATVVEEEAAGDSANLDGLPSYREEDGRCMWGIIKHLNMTNKDVIRLNNGKKDFRLKGQLFDVNGKTTFEAWEKNSSCDRLSGGIDATSIPALTPSNFSILVPVMCRNIPLLATNTTTVQGIQATRYIVDPHSLDAQACYCPSESYPCLPSGYLNLAPCYPEIGPPLAVSYPQSLFAESTPMLWGIQPRPRPSDHQIYMDINEDLGVPLAVQVRFQLSAVLRPDHVFPLLKSINSTKIMPVMWASEGFYEPTPFMVNNIRIALSLPTLTVYITSGACFLLGFILTALSIWYSCRKF